MFVGQWLMRFRVAQPAVTLILIGLSIKGGCGVSIAALISDPKAMEYLMVLSRLS
jgi:hypothetical protein